MIETTHGGITVRIDRQPLRFGLQIWIYKRRGDAVDLLTPTHVEGLPLTQGYSWRKTDSNVDYSNEPTMILDDPIGEALAAALSGYLPPDARTERHLDDARGLADRLLRIIEADFSASR
jgi:hypothetical protein